jgi:hypothetical protein
MSKKISLGLPSKGISIVKKEVNETPTLHLKDDSLFLNDSAMEALEITFKKGERSKVAFLSFAHEEMIGVVNATNLKIPNMVKSSIYKNGKISHSKLYDSIAGILSVSDTVDDSMREKVLLIPTVEKYVLKLAI